MRQIKRLDRAPANRFQKLHRGALRFARLSEKRLLEIEASKPGLIIEDDESLLIGEPARGSIDLQYSFPGRDAFRDRFPSMFQRLADSCSEEDAPFGFRFRLTERSSRAYVEPILTSIAFELGREWLLMELVELPLSEQSRGDIAPGFVLRGIRREDVQAIIELEELAFPNPQLTPDMVAERLQASALFRVLEETASKRVIGSLVGELREPGAGHIAVLAVHPDYQRRGLGEMITRWALQQFRERGLRRATLTTNVDNAPAIGLYRKLGFAPAQFGFDYRRPIDNEEVRQAREKNRAQHVSVRPRWSLR